MPLALKSNPARALGGALVICILSAPVLAQEENMASRMILELQQMREEVRELRGMVEAQGQEIENLKRRQRDQYVDLDRRLGQLRSGSDGQPAPQSGGPGVDVAVQTGPDQQSERPEVRQPVVGRPTSRDAAAGESPEDGQVGQVAAPEVRAPIEEAPEVVTLADPGTGEGRQLREPTVAEQQAYDQAFRALRETRYADAAEGFDGFLRDHPRSSYAPNALYWLGEVYYVTRDFETALAQFERLQETYPESSKKPDALLKIGFSHYELGNWDRARAALEQVIADYPGTNYSRLAENRLRTMRLEGNL